LSSIRLNTLFVSIGQVLRILMAMVLLPVASRVLGVEAFGRYSLATTVMFFVMLVDDLGLNMWVTREIAKYRSRAQRYLAYTIGLKVALIAASLIFVSLWLRLSPYDRETVQSIWIFTLYAILTSFRDLAIAIYRAYEDMQWESVTLSVEKILTTVFGVWVLWRGGGLIGLSWAFVAATLVSLLLAARILFKNYLRPQWAFSVREFIPMLRGAVVFGISVFLTTTYSRIDMMMLSFLKGPEVWGWYSAAHKLIDFTNMVPTVLMVATFPAFSRFAGISQADLDRVFTRGFKVLLLLAIPMVPGIFLLAEPVIRLFYGPGFEASVPALQILGCAAAILFINIYAAGIFGATNNQERLVVVQIFGLALSASLNYLLIPRWAHVGSSLACLTTEASVCTITLFIAFSRIVHLTERRFFRDALLAAGVMTGAIWLLRSLPVLLVVSAGVGVYFLLLMVMKTITWQEVLQIRKERREDPVL